MRCVPHLSLSLSLSLSLLHLLCSCYIPQAWEEKHVTVQLSADGFAGFSVVGGRDQPQLPNPGAFIITTVNQGGPADGLLKYDVATVVL